jgi:hypothetical protein
VDAYRLPQLVLGWEWGLLRFLRARVAGTLQPLHSHALACTSHHALLLLLLLPQITSYYEDASRISCVR